MANSIRGIVSANTNVAEISPALANFNLDFTLCRVEAPAEFHGVGRALTRGRRVEAESGQSHITARILGALFTSALPKTPNLSRVYGLRASEISKSTTEEASKTQSWGFFADHSGADGTTIWASATSGPDSIPTHLLACLLARVWDSAEAISIWEEIVRRRREVILEDFDKSNIADFRDVCAAKHPLSRDHLAEWDNSARSWLRTADRVKKREQKQVLLIFDNIEHRIRSDQGTYESVLSTWRETLTFFEAIVSGISQRASNGQSLLALCAWHLYPELMVEEPSPKHTKQNDALMPAKVIVTIGLGQRLGQQDGIYWSLPLAYLRHYGPAVKRETVLNSTQRLSVEEFEMAFFGTFIVGWTELGVTVVQIAQWLSRVHQLLLQAKTEAVQVLHIDRAPSWLGILFNSSKRFLKSFQAGENNDRQLVRLGQVHGQSFLGEKGAPFFGLLSTGAYMDCFKDEEESIAHLREIASKLPGDAKSMFLRIRHSCHELEGGAFFEYLTAKPMSRRCNNLKSDPSRLGAAKHCRWIYRDENLSKPTVELCYLRRVREKFPEQLSELQPLFNAAKISPSKSWSELISAVEGRFSNLEGSERGHTSESRLLLRSSTGSAIHSLSPEFEQGQAIYNVMGEDIQLRDGHVIEDYERAEMGLFCANDSDSPFTTKLCLYRLVYGSTSTALFVLESDKKESTPILAKISAPSLSSCFETDLIDADKLAACLLGLFIDPCSNSKRAKSLKAVSTAANIYRSLSTATIDVRSLQQDLSNTRWMARVLDSDRIMYDSFFPATLDLPSTFSCICFFESGRFDIEVSALQRVMAMSAGDRIWVASSLLSDPYPTQERDCYLDTVVDLTGNVGHPGISFLVPPVEPMIRPSSIHDFRRILHAPFDGNLTNDFHDTSLHLSFTSARSNLSGYFEGLKDSELEVLETALSVYEGGEWVADLDVLMSMKNASMRCMLQCSDCQQQKIDGKAQQGLSGKNQPGVAAISNWTELLDPPETSYGIVKASGNWEARLAATVICVASGYQTHVLPDTWCWKCVEQSRVFVKGKQILIA